MLIKEIKPKIILDSRKEKTIQVTIKTKKGRFVSSSPSGKSKGKYEAPAYNSRGIVWSIKVLHVLAAKLKQKNIAMKNFDDFLRFEKALKKFENNYEKLGANAAFALESAILKAAAKEAEIPLWKFILKGRKKIPNLVGNAMEGGMHSHSKTKPTFQEFLLVSSDKPVSRAVTKNINAYFEIKNLLKKKENHWKINRTDEKGWQTSLQDEDVFAILLEASKKYKLKIGTDAAASSFFNKGEYKYNNNSIKTKKEQITEVNNLIEKFKIFYFEDPLQEDDFSGFSEIKSSGLIVGDDLTVTNLQRIKKALKEKSINSVIIKPNQNGYLGEVSEICDFCKENKIKIIFSHRSGETLDNALADFAVGFGADYFKAGILGRERLVKLRRLIEIEKEN